MSIVGIDMGSSHLKAIEVEPVKNNIPCLLKYATIPSPDLVFKTLSDRKEDNAEVSAFLKKFFEDARFKDKQVVCTLPEYKVFTKIISMPPLVGKDLKQAVEWEATQYMPQSLSDVYLQYTFLDDITKIQPPATDSLKEKIVEAVPTVAAAFEGLTSKAPDKPIDLLLVATPKDVIKRYMKVLVDAGLYVVGIEPTSTATARGISYVDDSIPSIIVNIGHNNTDLYLVVEKKVRFVRTLQMGVSSFVRSISEELDMSFIQGHQYLYTYGFNEGDLNGKISEIIKPVANILVQELTRFISYVEKRANNADETSVILTKKVKRLLVCGGGALIPNLMLYLISNVQSEVEFADPWTGIVDISLVTNKDEVSDLGPLFPTALGAAIKTL
jgi:Tfp pilus assembly PilM family ATPase